MGNTRLAKTKLITPGKLGVNAASLASATTSNAFSGEGYRVMQINVDVDWVAATSVTMTVEGRETTSGNWQVKQSIQIVSGAGTLSDYTPSKAVTADKSYKGLWLDINDEFLRIKFPVAAGATTDTVTATVKLRT